MTNSDFWNSMECIIHEGFTSEGLTKLDQYAADFTSGKLVYKRFSPQEQYGCATGGYAHVIASIIAGAKTETDSEPSGISDFKRQQQRAATQAARIEQWAKTNAYFPETRLKVLGFGRDSQNNFRILVEEPFIEGSRISDEEIRNYVESIGFTLRNAKHWTYTTDRIYLSDMHDENVIRTK